MSRCRRPQARRCESSVWDTPWLRALAVGRRSNCPHRRSSSTVRTWARVASVVGADGTVAAQVSYDAWGKARDATNWTASVAEETLVELGVGFTGHAAEVDGGLTNMGGRMYDAAMGRFVQRDPVLANAANGASYNRYSYVENKPLRLVDPSGYAQQPDDDTGEGDGTGDMPGGNNGRAGGLDAGGGSDGEYEGLGYITIWVGSAVYHPNGWGIGGLGIAAALRATTTI